MEKSRRFIKHYHAGNITLAYNGFVDSINSKDQKMTLCGVGAHHQNGIIENKTKMLTTGALTFLFYGIRMWTQIIDDIFWPFSMKAVAGRLNSLQV